MIKRKRIRLGARSFYINVTKYLIKKLPLKNKLLKNLKCLHPLYIIEPQSLQCIKSVASSFPFVVASSEISKLVDEWICLQTEDLKSLQCVEKCYEESGSELDESEDVLNNFQRIDHFWGKVFQICNNSGIIKYKLLSSLIKAVLTLPHGNADCERGFSTNKRLLESRNRLNISSVNGLKQVKSHIKRLNNDISKFEINRGVLKAAKNAR